MLVQFFGPRLGIAILGSQRNKGRHMEVHFSPEKEARIRQFATRRGKDTAYVIEQIRADNPTAAHRVAQTIYRA